MSIPSLLGPIDTGDSFMITSIRGGQPFVLNGAPFENGLVYYWESNLDTIVASTTLGVFRAQGTIDALTIMDTINSGGIAFRSNGTTIGNATVPATLKMQQPNFANWFPPDIFLSSVPYTILNSSGVTANVLTAVPGTGGTGPTIPANNIIILPVLWYFNCTSSGAYDVYNQPLATLVNWFCVVTPNNPGCTGIVLTDSGWTNLPDCMVGNSYTYCPVGDQCGTDNCKGPCSVIYDDCKFSAGSNYVCVFDPEKYIADERWWTSPYFIGGVVGLIVIAIILIILVFAVARHGRNVSESEDSNSLYIGR